MGTDSGADTDVRVVLVTAPDHPTAERIGRVVTEERLAACANIVPGITSVYRWQGEVRSDGEVMVFLKTTDVRVEALSQRVAELHPYDVPEVLVLNVSAGHAPYLDWVRGETAVTSGGSR